MQTDSLCCGVPSLHIALSRPNVRKLIALLMHQQAKAVLLLYMLHQLTEVCQMVQYVQQQHCFCFVPLSANLHCSSSPCVALLLHTCQCAAGKLPFITSWQTYMLNIIYCLLQSPARHNALDAHACAGQQAHMLCQLLQANCQAHMLCQLLQANCQAGLT